MTRRTIGEIYETHAAFWDAQRGQGGRLMEKAYLDWVIAEADKALPVLDLGCGTGRPLAEALLRAGFAVTGMDIAPAMIAIARTNFPEGDWRVGDMREGALGGPFGAIVAWDSFFHLEPDEQRRMFPIFREALAPGGLLLFTSGPEAGVAVGEMNGEPLYHASLSPSEYRELLEANGIAVVEYHEKDRDCGLHTVWRCRRSE